MNQRKTAPAEIRTSSSVAAAASCDRTVPRMLQRQAERQPDRPLLAMGEIRWTHAQAADAAAALGAALRAAGIGRGERIALMCSNRAEALEVFLGCGWIGAVSVPINTASMAPQIRYFVENSGARVLVIEQDYVERLAELDFSKGPLETIWVIPSGGVHFVARKMAEVAAQPYPSLAQRTPAESVSPSEPLSILYTSGTTGPAKGVICSHAHYYWFGLNSARMLSVEPSDVLSTTLPLFHINALNTFAQASIIGCQVVIHPRFSASGFWKTVHACGGTVIYLLGAMVPMLLAQPLSAFERGHRVRVGLGGGAPGTAIDEFLARTGVPLVEGYASTETSVVIATPPECQRRGTMGWLQSGFQARVANELDEELPAGQAGELLLRADEPFAFSSGYFGMPDKTIEAWRNLWFHTGDRVVRDADGSFRFIDRMKDAIRRRGENVSSHEVEQALLSHPDVANAAVFPVRSDLAEDEIMAAVVAREGRPLEPATLARHCESRLPYFAIPRYFDIVADLPRTENGKVQKYKLREAGVTSTTWERLPSATASGRSRQA